MTQLLITCPEGHKLDERSKSIRGVYFCQFCLKEYEESEVDVNEKKRKAG